MNEITVGIVAIIILLGLFLTGIELAYAMAIIGFLGFSYLVSLNAACNLLAKDFFDSFINYGFTVIPLFVLMGQIAYYSGIAKKLFGATNKFIGHVPGGLAMATIVGATLFKAMCGSTLATCATFASVAIPEMERYGYSKKLSTGVVASVGTLGILLPPSITLIIFGIITEQSIGKLFLAGVFPALLVSALFMTVVYGWAKKNPEIAPKGKKATWGERWRSSPDFIAVAVIFILVIGGLMTGKFSPTEAGTIGTVAVLILAITKQKKEFSLKGQFAAIDESIRTGCMVLALIASSVVLGHFLAVTEIPMRTADWVGGLGINRTMIMVFIILIYLIGGSFIDDLAFMILATPIFYPCIVKLEYDPIWFGIMIGLTVMIGTVIPPVAMNVFVVKKITGESFGTIYSGVYPFLLGLFGCALFLFLFPSIATWLPSVMMPE